jgi:hypothetical protein
VNSRFSRARPPNLFAGWTSTTRPEIDDPAAITTLPSNCTGSTTCAVKRSPDWLPLLERVCRNLTMTTVPAGTVAPLRADAERSTSCPRSCPLSDECVAASLTRRLEIMRLKVSFSLS